MSSYSFSPDSGKKTFRVIACLVFSLFLIVVAMYLLELGNPVIWRALSIGCIVVLVYLFSSKILISYTYTMDFINGLFVIIQSRGKKQVVLAKLKLEELFEIRLHTEEDRVHDRDTTRYHYCLNVNDKTYLLFFHYSDKDISVNLPLDETMKNLLEELVKNNQKEMNEY